MTDRRPIRVRKDYRQHDHKLGYRWTCELCPRSGGFHAFDRWTDYVLAKHGKLDRHPWIRAMEGANLHHYRYHAPRGNHTTVTIHQATINIMGAS